MQPSTREAITDGLFQAWNEKVSITSTRSLSGGCINNVWQVVLRDGRQVLVKTNRQAPSDLFEREAEGLSALRKGSAIRVPEPIISGCLPNDDGIYLVTEWIERGKSSTSFFERFGEQLASLHRDSHGERFGFDHDNYLGSTPQPNKWRASWIDFFAEQRLRYQLDLATRKGIATGELIQQTEWLIAHLSDWLEAADELPTLIHGDLWSGNYLVDDTGAPALIDPAVYYGHREAELAMTYLFGGFQGEFYEAYQRTWPLTTGWEQRLEIYKLYHLLNHLNLFGSSYLGGCLQTLRQLRGSSRHR